MVRSTRHAPRVKVNLPKVFLCWTLNSGTTFYRMMNYVKYMQDRFSFGFSKWKPNFQEVADWEYKMDQDQVQKDIAFLLDECNLVIAQKFHWYGGLATLQACFHKYPEKPFLTELDDHIFEVNPESVAYDQYNMDSELTQIAREQIINSTGLVVSTEYLRTVYEDLNPNVWVVPNGIDFDVWDKLKPKVKRSRKIRIGWAGGGTHVKDLEFIKPAIDAVCKKFSNVEFLLLGGVPLKWETSRKIKGIKKWYPINEYPQAVKDLNIDIALAPLRDNAFNRAKSNLRWLEYSAMKVPTVASNVEPFKCIEDGKTGFLATEPQEWEDQITRLVTDEALRKRIGTAAYKKVYKDYNVVNIARDYCNFLSRILKGEKNISDRVKVEALRTQGLRTDDNGQ